MNKPVVSLQSASFLPLRLKRVNFSIKDFYFALLLPWPVLNRLVKVSKCKICVGVINIKLVFSSIQLIRVKYHLQ